MTLFKTLRTGATLAILVCAPAASQAQTPEERLVGLAQIATNIVETVRSDDGFMNEYVHEAFWGTITAADCEGCDAHSPDHPIATVVMESILPDAWIRAEYANSVTMSFQNGEPTWSEGLAAASEAWVNAPALDAAGRAERQAVIDATPDRLALAAAGRDPYGSGEPFNEEDAFAAALIEIAKLIRLRRLQDPVWNPKVRTHSLPLAPFLQVRSTDPFIPEGRWQDGDYAGYAYDQWTGFTSRLRIIVIPWTEPVFAEIEADAATAFMSHVGAFRVIIDEIELTPWINPTAPPDIISFEAKFGRDAEAKVGHLRLAAIPSGYTLLIVAEGYEDHAAAREAANTLSSAVRLVD